VADVVRLGGAIIGIFLLLFAVLLGVSRLYIHQFKKRMRKAHREI
jgi:hypothetical protein